MKAIFGIFLICVNSFGATCSGYSFSRTLTWASGQSGSSNSTNWPGLVNATISEIAVTGSGGHVQNTVTQSGGGASISIPADLTLSTASDCSTVLSGWEFETYTSTSGLVRLWLMIPTLSTSSNTVITMCYGKVAQTTQLGSVNGTWDTNFKIVQHWPNGTTLTTNDSTSNAVNLTTHNTPTAATGQIDGGASFVAASSQYMDGGTPTALQNLGTTATTYAFWIKPTTTSGNWTVAGRNDNNTVSAGWWIGNLNGTSFDGFGYSAEASSVNTRFRIATSTFSTTVFQYVVIITDGTQTGANQKIYYNNSSQAPSFSQNGSGTPGSDAAQTFYVGFNRPTTDSTGTTTTMDGILDEFSISTTARATSWNTASFNNQKPSSTMVTVGSESACTAGGTTPKLLMLGIGDQEMAMTFHLYSPTAWIAKISDNWNRY